VGQDPLRPVANVGSVSESRLGNTADTDAQLRRKRPRLQSEPPLIHDRPSERDTS
jgi:hypothetical protein